MSPDEILGSVTEIDTAQAPESVLRAALVSFVYRCSTEALDAVLRCVATLPERHLVEQDVQVLLGDVGQDAQES